MTGGARHKDIAQDEEELINTVFGNEIFNAYTLKRNSGAPTERLYSQRKRIVKHMLRAMLIAERVEDGRT